MGGLIPGREYWVRMRALDDERVVPVFCSNDDYEIVGHCAEVGRNCIPVPESYKEPFIK